MKILGIDPGTATTGFGVIECDCETLVPIDFGWINTPKENEVGVRLCQINRELSSLIEKHHPDVLAVERLFFFINAKTAMAVAESIGVIKFTAETHRVKVHALAPADIKLTVTGNGRADKTEVKAAVKRILNVRSPKKKKTHFDDLADALAVGICYARKFILKNQDWMVYNENLKKLKKEKTKRRGVKSK